MAASLGEDWVAQQAASGIHALPTKLAVQALTRALRTEAPAPVILGVDWAKASATPLGRSPLYRRLFVETGSAASERTPLVAELHGLPEAARRARLQRALAQLVAAVLGLDAAPAADQGFFDAGMDSVALVEGAPQQAEAEAFVEWLGSEEALRLAAEQAFRLPARTDIPAESLPGWSERVLAELVSEDVDWALIEERGAEWMTTWDREVRGQGP